MIDRRSLLKGVLFSSLAAPAIIRIPNLIMPIKPIVNIPEYIIYRVIYNLESSEWSFVDKIGLETPVEISIKRV